MELYRLANLKNERKKPETPDRAPVKPEAVYGCADLHLNFIG